MLSQLMDESRTIGVWSTDMEDKLDRLITLIGEQEWENVDRKTVVGLLADLVTDCKGIRERAEKLRREIDDCRVELRKILLFR